MWFCYVGTRRSTLIAGKLNQAGTIIVGFDSRFSLGESVGKLFNFYYCCWCWFILVLFSNIYVIFSFQQIDLGKKFEKISPKILVRSAWNLYDARKTLTHMKNNVSKRIFNNLEVHKVGKYDVKRTQRIHVEETTVTAE